MKPILLATDGSSTAVEATEKAIALARALDVPLIVASIWDLDYVPVGYTLGFVTAVPDLDRLSRESAEKVAESAAEQAREADVDVETVVRRGFPTQQICEIADENDVQLIVVGSHGWGAVRRVVFGSVSTGVLHHAKQPVLVVPSSVRRETERDGTRVQTEV
jgi:nucleotide-binding universal stress UspA family protein